MKPIEMESNAPVLAKRVWNMVRVLFFMPRKGISKGKLMMDLSMMLKRRGKLAGKAIANLMSHHHHHHHHHGESALKFSAPREYEFSCSNTPNNLFSFPIGKRHRHFFACAHAPPTKDDEAETMKAMMAVLEILNNDVKVEAASPALPGFGRSPMVRQLRVTDSPFPLRDNDADNDNQVDKKAEEFIKRFYKDLKDQD
ncbi:hypothetical protein CR513_02974, partial [Mucuna pruriens]